MGDKTLLLVDAIPVDFFLDRCIKIPNSKFEQYTCSAIGDS